MLEFARIVEYDGLEDELAYDGQSFGEKAAEYITAAKKVESTQSLNRTFLSDLYV